MHLGLSLAQAQTCEWTEDDITNGTLAIDTGRNWTNSDWLDWFNRTRPKFCSSSVGNVSGERPVSSGGSCQGNPYTNPDCFIANSPTRRVDNGWRFQIGKTYLHPYYGLSVTILGMLVNISGESVFVGETIDHVLRQFPIGSNPQEFAFYKEQ